jgi:hypothetical protein
MSYEINCADLENRCLGQEWYFSLFGVQTGVAERPATVPAAAEIKPYSSFDMIPPATRSTSHWTRKHDLANQKILIQST